MKKKISGKKKSAQVKRQLWGRWRNNSQGKIVRTNHKIIMIIIMEKKHESNE